MKPLRRHNQVSIVWNETYQVVDLLAEEIRDACLYKRSETFRGISAACRLSTQTIARIAYGETREPRPTTCLKLLSHFGFIVEVRR